MRVLLIYPRVSAEVLYGKIRDVGNFQMPLGIAYIGAYLREKGFEVQIIDAEVLQLSDKEILKEIARFNPEMVAFSSTTPVVKSAIALAEKTKKRFPKKFILIGGPHATFLAGGILASVAVPLCVLGRRGWGNRAQAG